MGTQGYICADDFRLDASNDSRFLLSFLKAGLMPLNFWAFRSFDNERWVRNRIELGRSVGSC